MAVAVDSIVAVWFTYSWNGFGIRYADGSQETFPVEDLERRVGSAELAGQMLRVATASYGTGCWRSFPPKPGRNLADE